MLFYQVEDDGSVDYDILISIIPDQYSDRVTKMIFACKHLGKFFEKISDS